MSVQTLVQLNFREQILVLSVNVIITPINVNLQEYIQKLAVTNFKILNFRMLKLRALKLVIRFQID